MTLVDRDDSMLLLIDAQEGFYPASRTDIDREAFECFLDRVAWIAGTAAALSVPVLVTEEAPRDNGPTSERVSRRLPSEAQVLEKPVFAAADNPHILAAVEAASRGTVALAGLETDVCVAQSAISLKERGYRVVAIGDALFSPGPAHLHGLERLRRAQVETLSAKELFYDWARSLEAVRRFAAEHEELADPPGFAL